MAKQVDTTYGNALFELAAEEGKIDTLYEEVMTLLPVLRENSDLFSLLTHPQIDKEEKKQVLENTFKGRISDELVGTMTLMADKDHGGEIISVFEYYARQVKKHKNIGLALVTSAVELTSAQKAAIEMKLIDTTSYKSIEAAYQVDPSLIGGLVIRIEDRVVDSSIRTKLNRMSQTLARS